MNKEQFGTLPDGRPVFAYTLSSGSLRARILNYGALVQDICFQDVPVILGYPSLEGYLSDTTYQGAVAGRHAGRISEGRFTLDGSLYQLAQNNESCHLHGGPEGFHKQIWKEEKYSDNALELSYHSPDGEEGYPGNLDIRVRYSMEGSALTLDYSAHSDKKTLCNPTNHTYFNLSGKKQDICGHTLQINSGAFAALGEDFAPDRLCPVDGTPFDFSTAKAIGQDIHANHAQLKQAGGYDHPFSLKKDTPQIRLNCLETGITLSVSTDQHAVIVYSGNFLKGTFLFRQGICFETQNFPNAANRPALQNGDPFTSPEKPYRQHTVWAFSQD